MSREPSAPLAGEVEQPSGTADDDVAARAQAAELRAVADAADAAARCAAAGRRMLSTARIWVASSRVGAMISARGAAARRGPASCSISGNRKARVLPDPVGAWITQSRRCRSGGSACSWTGSGARKLVLVEDGKRARTHAEFGESGHSMIP